MLDDAEKGLLIANYFASPVLDMYSIDRSTMRVVQVDHLGTVLICPRSGKKWLKSECIGRNNKIVRSTTTANDAPLFIRLSSKSSSSLFNFALGDASCETFAFMGLHFSTHTIYATHHKEMYIEVKNTVKVAKIDPKIYSFPDLLYKDLCPEKCGVQGLQKAVSKPVVGCDFGTIGKKRVYSDSKNACEDIENVSASTFQVVKRYKRNAMYKNRHALHVVR